MIESDLVIGPIEVRRLYSVNQLVRMNSGQVAGIVKSIKSKAGSLWAELDEPSIPTPYTFHLVLYQPRDARLPDADCTSWAAKAILDGATGRIVEDDNPDCVANVVLHTPEKADIPKPQYWAAFTEDIFKTGTA